MLASRHVWSSGMLSCSASTCEQRLAWVIMHPLGVPVVPEVKKIAASSSIGAVHAGAGQLGGQLVDAGQQLAAGDPLPYQPALRAECYRVWEAGRPVGEYLVEVGVHRRLLVGARSRLRACRRAWRQSSPVKRATSHT